MLRIVNLSKQLNGREVVKDVSFEVKERELFSITGRPGSGKSTLLKLITGLLTPDSGEIYLDGEKINDVPPGERGMSMVFENPPIYPDRTAYDNISFPLMIKKTARDEIDKRVKEISALLEITHILNRKPETFSGGEYQRVALARALITKPRMMLLDEPLKNLDAKIREKMKVWLKKLQRDLGITFIYATFDPIEALSIADRVGVMLEGKMEQVGTPFEVFNKPESLSVAEFVGIPTINTLNGVVAEKENQLVLEIKDKLLKLKVSNKFEHLTDKKDVIVGIRPENIEFELKENEKLIEGKLVFIQSLGSETLLSVEVKGEQIKLITEHFEEPIRGKLWLKICKVHVFDKITNKRLFTADVVD